MPQVPQQPASHLEVTINQQPEGHRPKQLAQFGESIQPPAVGVAQPYCHRAEGPARVLLVEDPAAAVGDIGLD